MAILSFFTKTKTVLNRQASQQHFQNIIQNLDRDRRQKSLSSAEIAVNRLQADLSRIPSYN